MIRLSVNVLDIAIKMLRLIYRYSFNSVAELLSINNTEIDWRSVFILCKKCNWCDSDSLDHPFLTDRGLQIISFGYSSNAAQYRILLEDYITCIAPVWRNRIPYGRKEAVIFMTEDEKTCFALAHLLDNYDDSTVSWWDNLSRVIREERDDNKLIVGREGEKQTIAYEFGRTFKQPLWKSLDSNLAGYDILSVMSPEDETPLCIEVKTASSFNDDSFFHITANEWGVARVTKNYKFYLWILNSKEKKLAIVSSNEISQYIPVNSLEGEWENVRIPVSVFKDSFRTMTIK